MNQCQKTAADRVVTKQSDVKNCLVAYLLTTCLLVNRLLFLLAEVDGSLVDLPADERIFWDESRTPEALQAGINVRIV